MLKFLRKYQKIFFTIIIFIIIVTFSFFGTQSVLNRSSAVKEDKAVAIAYDGSEIKASDVDYMTFFLATDSDDVDINNHMKVNLLNDGFLKKDILQTGLAKVFFEKYFDELKESLQKRFIKVKNYMPFEHVYNPGVSAEKVWQEYSPNMIVLLKKIKRQEKLNLEFVYLLVDLYNEQLKFNPEYLRRILIFLEKEKNLPHDPRLYQNSMALFGYNNVLDWFGKDFLNLVSQFVINTALFAKEKGCTVSYKEAFSDLCGNLNRFVKDKDNFSIYLNNIFNYLRVNEKTAVNIWQKVMIFRKYFRTIADSTLIDDLAYKEFADYSKTVSQVQLYQLPEVLRLKNFEDLMRFEMYLMVTSNKSNVLDVPLKMNPLEEIEKKYPSLITQKYVLKVKHAKLSKASLRVKIKDMTLWQIQNKNWERIRNKFGFVAKAETKEKKLDVLDKLQFTQKVLVDSFSREEMVKEDLTILKEEMHYQDPKDYEFYATVKKPKFPFAVKNPKELMARLQKSNELENYTENGEDYYNVQITEFKDDKKIMTFAEAMQGRELDKILHQYLITQYFEIKEKYPQKVEKIEEGGLEFNEARKDIIPVVFEDLVLELKTFDPSKQKSLNELVQYRFYPYVQKSLENLKKDKEYFEKNVSQFNLVKDDLNIMRRTNPDWIEDLAFVMEENSFSALKMTDGNIQFFYLKNRIKPDVSVEKLDIAKKAIHDEISSILIKRLMKVFQENQLMTLSEESKK